MSGRGGCGIFNPALLFSRSDSLIEGLIGNRDDGFGLPCGFEVSFRLSAAIARFLTMQLL
jgi:hypothetical protein